MLWPVLAVGYLLSRASTGASGVYRQERVGLDGRFFELMKLRTMRDAPISTTVTTSRDGRITGVGSWLRRLKIDELPQLVNVVRGDMSLVGPRPDVPGFADELEGRDRIVLLVPPGITGPASVILRDEAEVLAQQSDPERVNREVLFPFKVRLNREYVENYSLFLDVRLLLRTLTPRRWTVQGRRLEELLFDEGE